MNIIYLDNKMAANLMAWKGHPDDILKRINAVDKLLQLLQSVGCEETVKAFYAVCDGDAEILP